MALTDWRKKARKKAYNQKQRSSGSRDLSAERESKRVYARKKPEALLKARQRYEKSDTGAARRRRHSQSEKGVESCERYRHLHPEVGKQARERYAISKPEARIQAQKRYVRSKPEAGIQARKKYAKSKPEVGIRAREKYAKANPEVGAAASKRFRDKLRSGQKSKTRGPKRKADKRSRPRVAKMQIERQRRFLHLLPSREYSFVGGRSYLKTGRIVAQQRMVRNVLSAYRNRGKEASMTNARQLVQRAINKRNKIAASLKRQAVVLKEISDGVLAMADSNKASVTLADLCGDSGHEKRREPFFYQAAYKHPTHRLKAGLRQYSYARLRARAALKLATSSKVFDRRKVRMSCLRKRNLWNRLHKKVGWKRVDGSWHQPVIALGCESHPIEVSSWPCDHRCYYPENAVQRLTEVLRTFTNVSQVRCVLASNRIDSCSNVHWCHKTEPWYHDEDAHTPVEKRGHSLECLEGGCRSNLLFLRQLAVHFKRIDLIVRRVYKLLQADRELQKIDEALIRGDVDTLDSMTAEEKRKKGAAATLQRPEPELTPEEEMEFMPYTKALEQGYFEKPECVCASCRTMHYRKQVSEIFVKAPSARKEGLPWGLRPLDDRVPTARVGGENGYARPWNDLWEQLYHHLLSLDPSAPDPLRFFLCDKCYDCIKSGEDFSPLSIFNNMGVDEIPPELSELNEFERLCIQLGKCFQVVCRLGSVGAKQPYSDRLKVVKGQVLYYPLPVSETIRQLSEAAETAPTLHILLNSVPTRNGDIWQSVIRLEKVKAALVWLKENNPLYKSVDLHKWMASIEQMLTPDKNLEEEDEELEDEEIREACEQLGQRGSFPKGPDKPMMKELEPDERVRILDSYTIRPLDRELPQQTDLQMFQMMRVDAEKVDNRNAELDLACFSSLYPKGRFGQFASRPQNVTSSEFIKNRLMHEDPRFRRDHQHIFHLLWDSELRAVSQGIYQTLRNTKRYEEMPIDEFVKMVSAGNKELEYCLTTVFRNMRGTAEFWKAVKMQVLCMIRELGAPTWFLTLSAAEFDWEDMSEVLRAMNSDLPNIDQIRTSTLTAIDPVMTQNHFHHRFVTFFNEVILNKERPPLGLIWDYFWRIEYQARGHIHYHILLWVKDAPRVGVDSDETVKAFINKHATCRLPDPEKEPILHRLVTDYQMHRCGSYCLKTVKTKTGFIKKCRFGYPRPVRNEIQFRDPLETIGKRRVGKFEKRFYDLPRTESEQRINDYCPHVLLGWKANMDVSFVGESTTALANYVCGYVTKPDKGATEMFESIDRNEIVWKQLYAYAFAKLRNRECGIIEAVDRLRGQPLYQKSRQTKYINARMPSSRTVCMKSWSKLQEMQKADPTSTDKYEQNWIDDFYPNRPETEEFEQMCLYDFRRLFDKTNRPRPGFQFRSGGIGIVRRNEPFLISHPVFKKPEDVEKYRYSLLLLFKPFRNEVAELFDSSGKCSSIFETELVTNHRLAEYHQKLQAQVAQLVMQDEAIQKAAEASPADSPEMTDAELLGMPAHVDNAMEELRVAMAARVAATSWEEDCERLNGGQLGVFRIVSTRLTEEDATPFRMFVCGAGGTGKSFLIHTIRKFVQSHFFEADGPTVAIAGPTGLAAFNVGGVTLHRLFKLPVQHGTTGSLFSLNADEKKQLAFALHDLKLIMIDEISMVSNLLLLYVDKRMQEIFRSRLPFGGISILVFGDFAQLQPVNAQYVFETIPADVILSRNLGVGSSNIWQRDFDIYRELTENMRQNEDPAYAAILDRLRFGQMTSEDAEVIAECLIKLESAADQTMLDALADHYFQLRSQDPGVVCLLPKSDMVAEFNSYILQKEGRQVVQVVAIDQIHGYKTRDEPAKIRAQLQKRSKRVTTTAGVEMVLDLAVGARIMLRRNVDVEKGLVNGAIGSITEFVRNGSDVVTSIKVLFDGQPEPQEIHRVSASFNMNTRVVVFLQQLPIVLAYSITIHKAQGMSLSTVLLDVGSKIFQTGMTYVGLSRVRTLAGLHLINFDPSKARCNERCIIETNRLRRRFAPEMPQQGLTFSKLRSRKDRVWYTSKSSTGSVDPTANIRDTDTGQPKQTTNRRNQAGSENQNSRKGAAKRKRAPASTDDADLANVLGQLSRISPNWPTFSNPDATSCYASTAIHLLFSCRAFCSFLQQDTFGQRLKALVNLYQQYENHKAKNLRRALSVAQVRNAMGYPYLKGQQDTRQFLESILNRLMLEDLFRLSCLRQCTNENCNKHGSDDRSAEYFLVLDPTVMRSFPQWIRVWETGEMFECAACKLPCMRQSFDLANSPQQILVNIDRRAGLEEIVVPGCDPDQIRIGDSNFEVAAVIQHLPSSLAGGHYVAFIRTAQGWVKCDDARVEFSDFPFGLENVYVMLLEKKTEEMQESPLRDGTPLSRPKKAASRKRNVQQQPASSRPAQSRVFGNFEQASSNIQVPNWPFFANTDSSSSYANSAVQFLFRCPRFCEYILHLGYGDHLPELVRLHKQYETCKAKDQKRALSTIPLRKVLESPFTGDQQDAREFIEKILSTLSLQDLVRPYRRRCVNAECQESRLGEQVDAECFLVLDPGANRTFAQYVQAWLTTEVSSCHRCRNQSSERSISLQNLPDQLLVHIARHTEDGFENRTIESCNPDEIRFDEYSYRVVSAIQHTGGSARSGQYMALVRTEMGWLRCNDRFIERVVFPQGLENVYLLLLEKNRG